MSFNFFWKCSNGVFKGIMSFKDVDSYGTLNEVVNRENDENYIPNMIRGVKSVRWTPKFNIIEANISLKTKSFLSL